jgi:hypothetical protein
MDNATMYNFGYYKYYATLINNQDCIFDKMKGSNLTEIKKWAKYRGNLYTLRVETEESVTFYTVKSNRMYKEREELK